MTLEKLEIFTAKTDLKTLHPLKLRLDDAYYNECESLVSDDQYDILKDALIRRDPRYVPPIGAKIRQGENRTEIPFWLGSMDKITPKEPGALDRWVRDNPAPKYITSDKLDGVSFLAIFRGGTIKIYTRGDGVVGADISVLAQYFSTLPKDLNKDIVVRGELIIKKSVFEKYRRKTGDTSSSHARTYKNARSMVAGLINGKTIRKGLKDIDCVVYEIVGTHMIRPSKQMKKLQKLGFTVVKYEVTDDIEMNSLSDRYVRFREESPYEIDGVIVQPDNKYDRNVNGNPDYAFAFKMLLSDAVYQTTITSIEWNVSKWGQLKPVAIVDPVELPDITISRLTAHNAKYVDENNLGPGAVIKVTRSKEVIPYIVSVVEEAAEPSMPMQDYRWDKNHVNISVTKHEDTICIKLISTFFAKLGIKHVSEATVRKMVNNGLDTLLKIIGASQARLLKVPEFQKRSAERIWTNIHEGLQDANLAIVLGASGVFGFGIGRKRMAMLLLDIPNLLTIYKTKSTEGIKNLIIEVEGFSEITADKVARNLKWADIFIRKLSKYATFKEKARVSEDMKGKKFVMTGFRDKKLEEDIASRGGKVVGSVSKNTTGLIVARKGAKLTGKSQKAHSLGVPIYEKSEFIEKYIG